MHRARASTLVAAKNRAKEMLRLAGEVFADLTAITPKAPASSWIYSMQSRASTTLTTERPMCDNPGPGGERPDPQPHHAARARRRLHHPDRRTQGHGRTVGVGQRHPGYRHRPHGPRRSFPVRLGARTRAFDVAPKTPRPHRSEANNSPALCCFPATTSTPSWWIRLSCKTLSH